MEGGGVRAKSLQKSEPITPQKSLKSAFQNHQNHHSKDAQGLLQKSQVMEDSKCKQKIANNGGKRRGLGLPKPANEIATKKGEQTP
jgi:hypothetical protein